MISRAEGLGSELLGLLRSVVAWFEDSPTRGRSLVAPADEVGHEPLTAAITPSPPTEIDLSDDDLLRALMA